jgi:hypothetical protein
MRNSAEMQKNKNKEGIFCKNILTTSENFAKFSKNN